MNIRAYILMIGLEEAAKKLEVSLPAVKHYRNGIRQVSPVNVISVCAATGWQITPHELRPDVYPNPTDGLPAGKEPGEAA